MQYALWFGGGLVVWLNSRGDIFLSVPLLAFLIFLVLFINNIFLEGKET
jgi:hypothetical protein